MMSWIKIRCSISLTIFIKIVRPPLHDFFTRFQVLCLVNTGSHTELRSWWLIWRSTASCDGSPDAMRSLHAITRKPWPQISCCFVSYPVRRSALLIVFSLTVCRNSVRCAHFSPYPDITYTHGTCCEYQDRGKCKYHIDWFTEKYHFQYWPDDKK